MNEVSLVASRFLKWVPRDGLQNENASLISTDDKDPLHRSPFAERTEMDRSDVFREPESDPQLADAAEVFNRIHKAPGVRYPVLVPNLKGYERARLPALMRLRSLPPHRSGSRNATST